MMLNDLRTVGRSGLLVSPLALGTMTFGNHEWGADAADSKAIFDRYVEGGGNFIDTADVYADGRSEELLGGFIGESALRDRLVLATKYSFNGSDDGNALAGGNGRKNLYRALESSLRRLRTDYVDLYWMHVWDRLTPVEEVVQSLGDLVHAGRIRYFGFSDVPAWYAARAVTLAQMHGGPVPIALQLEYSLTERTIEREHVPAARELGLGITPWSPLASGFLAGKYSRNGNAKGTSGGGRLDRLTASPLFNTFTDRNWKTLDAVRTIAAELGRSPAQTALAWTREKPGITSPILGARTVEQLSENLASLDVALNSEQMRRLDDASATDPVHPYSMFGDDLSRTIFENATVTGFR
ncbi:MAG: aldo/keto reductase [Candidatus Eremiobacteraeota bacterium]|nr:aldo/keto reductase [Candidatus Eremiobacteraeota bacterium]